MARFKFKTLERANAKVLAELLTSEKVSPFKRQEIIDKLNEDLENRTFFQTMFEESLSYGECPECNLKTHWAIPENNLNEMGHVSHEQDPRIPKKTNKKVCPEFHESCLKKKISV
jgi:hypothetical protein